MYLQVLIFCFFSRLAVDGPFGTSSTVSTFSVNHSVEISTLAIVLELMAFHSCSTQYSNVLIYGFGSAVQAYQLNNSF